MIEDKRDEFPEWFFRLCTKVDYAKSDEEETHRYHKRPPYMERISMWIDKFYKPNFTDE